MNDTTTRPPQLRQTEWLRGVRVLEVTTGVSAPLSGRICGDLGAEVIRLESRAKIDVNRARVPRPDDPEGFPAHESFQLLHESNAGKRSVTVNLKSEQGRELFRQLLSTADVLLENFVPGWLERVGFTVSGLLEEFPRLVIFSASAAGQTGPMRTQRSYAPVMTALAGVEGLIGYEGEEPLGCMSLALADLNCSFFGVFLVGAALAERRRTGRGQHIDLSQVEASIALIGEAFLDAATDAEPGPRGNHLTGGEATLSCTDDGVWSVSVHTDGDDGDSQAQPVLSPDDVEEEFARRGRRMTQIVQHPHEMITPLAVTSLPWVIDGARPLIDAPSPLLGADNEAVFGQLGLQASELAELIDEKVVF